jgi:excisionase family DNA binding protein
MDKPQYLTVNEVAELLRVTPATVWSWCRAKRLPAYKWPGSNKWFIDAKRVEKMQKAYAREYETANN